MGFIKKKLFWIICIVVVLAGLAVFFYSNSIASANKEQIDEIDTTVTSVSGMRSKAEPANIAIIQQLQSNVQLAQSDAAEVQSRAMLTSQRDFFFERHRSIFPRLVDDQQALYYYGIFGDAYVEKVQQFLDQLNAQGRPSPTEEQLAVDAALNRNQPDNTQPRGGPAGAFPGAFPGGGMMPGMGPQQPQTTTRRSTGAQSSQQERVIEQLRRTRADEISVYAAPQIFTAYDYWKAHSLSKNQDTMLLNSWFTQIAAWIQQDIVSSVLEVNGDSSAVSDSPIKRIIEISFSGQAAVPDQGIGIGAAPQGGRSTSRTTQQDAAAGRRDPAKENNLPAYVIKDEEEDTTIGDITTAFTKRFSNDLYDVVQFEMAVIIETTAVTDFINALQNEKPMTVTISGDQTQNINRSPITVLQMHLEPVNIEMENATGYYYGQGSLATLRLVCEYIFFTNRKAPRQQQIAYEQAKPQPVKEIFEPEEDTATRR